MKTSAVLIASAAAAANAQATYNSSTGKFDCDKPNVAYCGGASLDSDIIIRCDENRVGQPGRCSDNLAGEFPVGNYPSLCWQTSEAKGDAACEKNCVVYGNSGNYDGTFTLPADQCSPTASASGSQGVTSSASVTASGTTRPLAPSSAAESGTTTVVDATSFTTTCPESSATTAPSTPSSPAVVPPPLSTGGSTAPVPSSPVAPSSPAVVPPPLSTGVTPPSYTTPVPAPPAGTGTVPAPGGGNSTTPTTPGGGASGSNTPVGPTTTAPSTVPTAAAAMNKVGGLLAGVGLFAAYFL